MADYEGQHGAYETSTGPSKHLPSRYPNIDVDSDALSLTNTLLSEHNSFDSSPWILKLTDFTRKALAHPRVRVIGVCFGHQIVGRALAGDKAVGRNDKGWEAAVDKVQLTTKGKELFGGKDVMVSRPSTIM